MHPRWLQWTSHHTTMLRRRSRLHLLHLRSCRRCRRRALLTPRPPTRPPLRIGGCPQPVAQPLQIRRVRSARPKLLQALKASACKTSRPSRAHRQFASMPLLLLAWPRHRFQTTAATTSSVARLMAHRRLRCLHVTQTIADQSTKPQAMTPVLLQPTPRQIRGRMILRWSTRLWACRHGLLSLSQSSSQAGSIAITMPTRCMHRQVQRCLTRSRPMWHSRLPR